MYETSLDKVLNYMKQYVENKFEHDSEPMLNYKDLELVLNYIDKQKDVLDKIKELMNTTPDTNYSYDYVILKSEIYKALEEIE